MVDTQEKKDLETVALPLVVTEEFSPSEVAEAAELMKRKGFDSTTSPDSDKPRDVVEGYRDLRQIAHLTPQRVSRQSCGEQ